MSWRAKPAVLLLLGFYLHVQCQAETVQWCHGDMWSEPQAVFVGESFEVFCRCNTSRVRLQDMYIKPSHSEQQGESTPIDEYTIKHRVEVDHPRQFFKMHCLAGEDYLGEIYVNVVPILNVTNIECRKFPTDTEATCTFKELGFAAAIPKKSYSLSIDGHPRIPCFKGPHYSSWIECRGLYIPRDSKYAPNHQIELLMEYEGHNQTQVFTKTLREMTVPEWPMSQPKFQQDSYRICLKWAHTSHSDPVAISQNWEVGIHSENPRIQPLYYEIRLIPLFSQDICLPKLPYANQVYWFQLRRRYNITGAPWSIEFKTNSFTSIAAIPAHPPNLLLNGFYHDPEKRELYVFCWPLDDLELNGPNFTYAAATNLGKKPSSVDNNYVIFSNWDPTIPATIFVWSQNSVGTSTTSIWLEVPPLTNSGSRQPLDLRYHEDNYTLTWQPPKEQQNLTGYAISWCLGSTNRFQICNDQKPILLQSVPGSQLQFPFNESMQLSNVAVTAGYQDKPSDGMKWIGPGFQRAHKNEPKTTGLSLTQVIAVIISLVALLSLGFLSLRKLRKMANIEVDLPNILFKSVDIQISSPEPPVCIAVPGNYPPKGMLTIDILTREYPVEEEASPDQDYNSKTSTINSDSQSSSSEEISNKVETETQSPPSPYVTLGTGYVMTPF